jgi:hypothetical protein
VFESALQAHKNTQDVDWTITTTFNLAYSLAETGRIDEAQGHAKTATLLDSDHKHEPARLWVEAQIAYQQHDSARVVHLCERFFTLPADDDVDAQIDVATLAARAELERNDFPGAERWAQKAVVLAEHVRNTQSAFELRSWVLAKRRAPYELLFTALARSQRTEDAIMALDAWLGRSVQDALARPRPPASMDYRRVADQLAKLGGWLRVVSQAPIARRPDPKLVPSTMRRIDLLALVVADGYIWRLTANHGAPRLTRLVRFGELESQLRKFRDHAADAKSASELGELLLPDEIFRETHDPLYVVIDPGLNALPVAALRHGETMLSGLRPVVYLLRLPEAHCAHMTHSEHRTVIGVSDTTLPSAVDEAQEVARLLSTTSQTGTAATRAALLMAGNDEVLHVAAHGAAGAAVALADGEISALEISASQVAPGLVVLSSCAGATPDPPELDVSLVAGFLGAGSQHVVAATRSVSDAGALDISTRFYGANGVAEPARALAAVQSELAKAAEHPRTAKPANIDWPYFAVFAPDVCLDN